MTEERPQSLNVQVSQQISVPLKDYIDQRFKESDKAADFRLKFAEEILKRVETRCEAEFIKLDTFLPRDIFTAYVERVTNDFNGTHEAVTHTEMKFNKVYSDLRDELSKLELRIVGKDIFSAYVQRTADEISKAKEEIHEASELAATVREASAKALSDTVIAQNNTINSRFEDATQMIIASKEEMLRTIGETQKRPWHLYIMSAGIALTIFSAFLSGLYLIVISPMQAREAYIESRMAQFENDHNSTQQMLKDNQQQIMDKLSKKNNQ